MRFPAVKKPIVNSQEIVAKSKAKSVPVKPKKKKKAKNSVNDESPVRESQSDQGSYLSASKNPPRIAEAAEYLNNPPPVYPRSERRKGRQGLVKLLVGVNVDGTVSEISIEASSGHRLLDQAAVEAVKKWKFLPATAGGDKVASQVLVPIQFKIVN